MRDSPPELARPFPGPYASTSSTSAPACRSWYATHAPKTPAPTTAISALYSVVILLALRHSGIDFSLCHRGSHRLKSVPLRKCGGKAEKADACSYFSPVTVNLMSAALSDSFTSLPLYATT